MTGDYDAKGAGIMVAVNRMTGFLSMERNAFILHNSD
jgi:hypothetical protein